VVTIDVPPLRERREDVVILMYHFIKQFCLEDNKDIRRVPTEVTRLLEEYHWPGNVRELRNVLQRLVLLSTGNELNASSLPGSILDPGQDIHDQPMGSPRSVGVDGMITDALLDRPFNDAKQSVIRTFTRSYLGRRLAEAGGNITRAADASGILRPNFKRLMK
jgi:two-component system nitrogen regulation response regulator NtrX